MKKLLLCTCYLFITAAAGAQVRFGPEAGLNLSNATESGYSTSMRAGFRLGGIADIALGEHFALQPGIFFTTMGNKFSTSLGSLGSYSGSSNLNYIYVPIDLLYKFGEEGYGRFFIGLGPEIGYCLGGKETIDGTSQTLKVGNSSNSNIKPLDFGLNSLIGYELPSGLMFRVGYYAGFADVQTDANKNIGGKSVYNYAIQISAAWLFGGNNY